MNKIIHKVEIVPVTNFTNDESINNVASGVFNAHVGLAAGRILRQRGLAQVRADYRYGELESDPNVFKQLKSDRQAMLDGQRETYAIRTEQNTERDQFVGLATIDHQATLRRSHIAGRVARMVPILSSVVPTEGSRINAWVGDVYPYDVPTDQEDTLADVYNQLCETAGEGSWTVEPRDAPAAIHKAIQEAGMTKQGEAPYIDLGSQGPVLPGILYQY